MTSSAKTSSEFSPYGHPYVVTAEELAAGARQEAAREVLAVLGEAARAGRVTLADEAPAAMISGRSLEGRVNAALPAGVEPRPSPVSMAGQPCALGSVPRLLPLGFPLVPLSGT